MNTFEDLDILLEELNTIQPGSKYGFTYEPGEPANCMFSLSQLSCGSTIVGKLVDENKPINFTSFVDEVRIYRDELLQSEIVKVKERNKRAEEAVISTQKIIDKMQKIIDDKCEGIK